VRGVKVVAVNTIREGIRDKVFLNLLLFGVLMIGASVLMGDLSIGQSEKFIKDIGLAAISLIGVLTAILLSTGLLHRELDRRTVYSVIYRPIPRWHFLLGKYLGICAIVALNVAVMNVMFLTLLLIRGYAVQPELFKAIYLTYAEAALMASVGTLLSLIFSPTPSVIFTAAIYVAGQMTGELREMASASQALASRYIAQALYYLLPNLGALNLRAQAAYGLPIDPLYLLRASVYAAAYVALIIALAMWRFERRELG
jgi:ABC-type transport system involved in multi-copper enzyme maturation permease subunit